MTARQVYEAVLIEMNKVLAPSLILEEFNYLFNSSINKYVNKRYNMYDVSQQTTDDLRVLKSTAILTPHKSKLYDSPISGVTGKNALFGATYELNLPVDYLHLLNCVCQYKVNKTFKCYDKDTHVWFGATRLTSDLAPQIINNFYMRPQYKKPYYYIHNVNTVNDTSVPTNPYNEYELQPTGFGTGTDVSAFTIAEIFEFFIKNNPDYEFSYRSGIVDADVNEKVLSLKSGEYLCAEKDGMTYSVVYNFDTQKFEFRLSANAQADVNNNTLISVANSTHVGVLNNVLMIDEKEASSSEFIVNDIFLENYGRTYNFGSLPKVLKLKNDLNIDLVEKPAGWRLANPTNVRMEIRYGKDDSLFELDAVYVDYIKAPQQIRLTLEQLDLVEDTSQIMEFPEYVCQEIIYELVHTLMENSSDPRLQTHMPVSMSIANPAQQLEQSKK